MYNPAQSWKELIALIPVHSGTQICGQLPKVAFVSTRQAGSCALQCESSDMMSGTGGDLVRAIANHQIQLMLGDVLYAAACRLHGCNCLLDALLSPPVIRCCSIAQLSLELPQGVASG